MVAEWGKDMNRQFTEKDTQKTDNNVGEKLGGKSGRKLYSIPLVVFEF